MIKFAIAVAASLALSAAAGAQMSGGTTGSGGQSGAMSSSGGMTSGTAPKKRVTTHKKTVRKTHSTSGMSGGAMSNGTSSQ